MRLAVDGVTPFDYALVPDHASLDITGAITLATWVKPELVATQDVMKKATNASVNGYEITLASSGKPFVRFNQVASGDTLRINGLTSYPVTGTTWMHIAATYDGTTIRLYVNGVEEATLAATFTIATNNVALSIGAQHDGTRGFRGQLDDARVYSGALSAADILGLASAPTPTPTSTSSPTATPTRADAHGNSDANADSDTNSNDRTHGNSSGTCRRFSRYRREASIEGLVPRRHMVGCASQYVRFPDRDVVVETGGER